MTIASIYAGVQQADVASMTIGGITYRCFVWVEAPNDAGPQRVGAAVMAEGEDGQMVLVDKSIVATATGDAVDCPRILAVQADSLFVVHWIDHADTNDDGVPDLATLFRALFSVTAIGDGWANQGSVALHATCQYDHATVEGDTDNEFIVSRRTASGTITTTRYSSPFTWADIAWNDPRAGLTIADTVLACHANASDNVALVSYQDTLLLRTYRLDADDGGTFATAETFPDVLDGDLIFTAVSHVRIGTGIYLVAAEAIDNVTYGTGSPDTHLRLVCWRQIGSADAAGDYRSHWLKNTHLESRLWTWSSGVTGEVEAFSGWAYKTIFDGGEFTQMVGGVMRYDIQALDDYPETSGVIRPIPCSVVVNGTWDARPHGLSPAENISIGKRLNHLSHATGPATYSLGPYKKGMLFAHTRWARLAATEDSGPELQPVEAGVAYHQFTHVPPWTLVTDEKEPAQPDTEAWRGVTPTHALPIETPAGLVWTGGVTTTYDGYQKVEMGFVYTTELRVSTTGDDPIGTAGDYYYTVIPVWIDARGNSHRGPPSQPVSITLNAMQGADIDIRCINLTMKDDRERYPAAQRIYFEVYRTYLDGGGAITEDADTGGALFRSIYGGSSMGAAAIQGLPASDHEEYFVNILDGVPNNIVQYNELAPFQLDLDTLLWTPPPPIPHQPMNVGALWQNRLFCVDPEGLLRWSEEILPRGADLRKPEFLDTNVMRLAGVDRVTGLVGLDNDLGLLHRDGVDQIAGDPGAGGSGNTLQQRVISRGYGCIEARSVCIFDGGATFQSAKRLHVLTRGSGVTDLGGPVEDAIRAGGNVRGVAYLEDRDELRFLYQATPGTGPLVVRPRVAVYNVRSGLWTTRVLPLAGALLSSGRLNEVMHSTTWRGLQGDTLHVVLFQGGMIRERASTDTSYADEAVAGSTAVRLDVTTEWITMGLDSTKRYPEIGIITERTHAGPLTIESWYDHDGSFDSDSGASEYTLTVASPAPAFIRFRPVPSKCRAIKLRIYEPSGAPSTENVRLVAIVVHWMAKKQRQGSRNNAA